MEEEGEGMGGICMGRVRARKPLFTSCFVKLMRRNGASEYSLPTPDSHSHHQQCTPFVLSSSQDMHHHLPALDHTHAHSHHTHSHHAHSHSHSLTKGLDTQAVNLMALPSYAPLPPQHQTQRKSSFPRPAMFLLLLRRIEVKGVKNQ